MSGGPPHPRRSAGQGRGHTVFPHLEFWEDRPGRIPGSSHVKRDPVTGNFKLHVRSIPPQWDLTVFKNVFSKVGDPMNLYISPNRTATGLGWGFVEFATYQEANMAVEHLSNNVLLNIQVMFAREKPPQEELDPVLRLLSSYEPGGSVTHNQSTESHVARPQEIVRTVVNHDLRTISANMPFEDYHKPIVSAEDMKYVEEYFFQVMLDRYRKIDENSGRKCHVCEANCCMVCADCTSVFYCSPDCQTKDWNSHSRNCKGTSLGGAEDVSTSSQGGDQQRQARSEFTNGFGSDNRTNRFGDRRNNRDGDRGNFRNGDRGNFRDGDRGNVRDGDRGNFRDRGQRPDQSNQQDWAQGKKSLFEERKSRIANSSRQSGDDRGFQSRFGQSNQQGGEGTSKSFKPRADAVKDEDEDWGSDAKGNGVKDSSRTTPGLDFIEKEKAFLEEIKKAKEESKEAAPVVKEVKTNEQIEPATAAEEVNQTANTTSEIHQPGLRLEVVVICVESPGLFWVQRREHFTVASGLYSKLSEHMKSCSSQFVPVKDGVCGIFYEDKWYRCQVTSLEPLTVCYIDYGYPEEVEPSRLFELSSELKALPPYAFKIKLVDGTPESILPMQEGATVTVKLMEKGDSYWSAQPVTSVQDQMVLPEVPETVTPNVPTTIVPSPTPTANEPSPTPTAIEPSPTRTAIVSSPTPTAIEPSPTPTAIVPSPTPTSEVPTETQQQPSTTQLSSPKPFPHMFDAASFTTVVITYRGDTDQKDTYYVGAATIWGALQEMVTHFGVAAHHSEVLTPRPGTMGLAMYSGSWYRVRVVSLDPLLAHYIDFGNVEPLEPEALRKCPDTYKDVPNLVHKVKLAPGTSEKYFNLPDESEINVKPVAWLADGTVLIEVEGENYKDTLEPIKEQENVSPSLAPDSKLSPSGPVEAESKANAEIHIKPRHSNVVDLLQEKWKVSFSPNKIDYMKNSLLGLVYSPQVTDTYQFMAHNDDFQKHLSSLEFDSSYRPSEGEIVGLCFQSGDWERGRVLPQQGLLALHDQGGVIRSSQLFKLPESYAKIPSLAAVLSLCTDSSDLLLRLADEEEILFDVVKVTSNKGCTVAHVINSSQQITIEGELRSWDYDPLETSDPLATGDLVTITKVIDSNTLLVTSADNLESEQTIQIECLKTCEEFTSPPIEGDYVSFFDKDSDAYLRCKINKVENDDYDVFCFDIGAYHKAKLSDLHPLPSSLRNLPCLTTQIELRGVDKVDLTENAQIYLSHIAQEDKALVVGMDDSGTTTLTVKGEEETLNNKLKELLKPVVKPNEDGKLTILSLGQLGVPLNKEFDFIVCQVEPLYVQIVHQSLKYYTDLHGVIQTHCASDNAPYNPCVGELCLSLFDGEWYRCRCLKETNTGVSVLMLVDYGNIFNAQTSNIRRILPEMLTMPSIATSCKIHGLPDPVSPALKARLNEILEVNVQLHGTFVAENDNCFEVVIDSVKQAIQDLQ